MSSIVFALLWLEVAPELYSMITFRTWVFMLDTLSNFILWFVCLFRGVPPISYVVWLKLFVLLLLFNLQSETKGPLIGRIAERSHDCIVLLLLWCFHVNNGFYLRNFGSCSQHLQKPFTSMKYWYWQASFYTSDKKM